MEVLLVPEVDLVELLHVKGLVSVEGHVEDAPGGEQKADFKTHHSEYP